MLWRYRVLQPKRGSKVNRRFEATFGAIAMACPDWRSISEVVARNAGDEPVEAEAASLGQASFCPARWTETPRERQLAGEDRARPNGTFAE